jgi:PadR family transcriptional regulator PadR
MLAEGDAYGYSLTQNIRETLEVSESTLYPVMRRLQTGECLTTYDEPHSGRNRRYYKITERGLEKLVACVEEWNQFKQRIDFILGGGSGKDGELADGSGADGLLVEVSCNEGELAKVSRNEGELAEGSGNSDNLGGGGDND